jgi:hypothetical protein
MRKPSPQVQEQFRIWQKASPDKRESVAAEQAAMRIVEFDLADVACFADPQEETIMVNGKRFGDCAADEASDMAEWFRQLGEGHKRAAGRLAKRHK